MVEEEKSIYSFLFRPHGEQLPSGGECTERSLNFFQDQVSTVFYKPRAHYLCFIIILKINECVVLVKYEKLSSLRVGIACPRIAIVIKGLLSSIWWAETSRPSRSKLLEKITRKHFREQFNIADQNRYMKAHWSINVYRDLNVSVIYLFYLFIQQIRDSPNCAIKAASEV